ncbi:dolichyl-phosphate-mannose-protein mannosyltransferase [Maribacter vaceletii]|uniref:Dolichyl-phosphate-mannose-protein mannosyltransferase n=1 Tax=Maribacter vaceletii TaxID=1206816 RepID=A0A495DSC8_9FLAO|nr:glycosyltransferase family 39 protein [Maribacter vaceletii]RKR06502.1 dolichyl-phosphate-mannose-protein mannosyltransferase [Maribacter vaceletii]
MFKKVTILALLSGLAIICISYMKAALELEDAEQAFYSQWWRLTYDDQPPLYTWLQILVNKVFGVTKFSFSFLRALLFSGTIGSLYFFGKQYLKNKEQAALAVILLALVPVFIDFTFRRLSHTSLLCLSVVLTFIFIQRLITNKSTFNYVLLGLVISLGILTKYNYFLMLGALFLAIPFNSSLKKIILNKRILGTIALIVILIFPHFYDLFSSSYFVDELHKSVVVKTNTDNKNTIPVISSFLAFFKSIIILILPIFLFFGFLFWKKNAIVNIVESSWLKHVFIAQILVLLVVFVSMNTVKVHARWLLPLFIPYIVLLLSLVKIKGLNKYVNYGFIFFLFIIFAQTIRTPIEKVFKIPSSVHYSFNEISEDLNTNFKNKQWVLPDVTYAGNIRFLNPGREVLSLDDFTLPKSKEKKGQRVVVKINSDSLKSIEVKEVHRIDDFGKEKENLSFYLD